MQNGVTLDTSFVASGFLNGPLSSGWVSVAKISDTAWKVTSVQAVATFPQHYNMQGIADYAAAMQTNWKIRVTDEDDVRDVVGQSQNPVYVTRLDPINNANLYHTVVHIGCVAAKAQYTEQAAFNMIWAKFTGDNICIQTVIVQNGVVALNPGGKLYYYGIPDNVTPTKSVARTKSVDTTMKLLQFKDGICYAWSDFFRDTLKAQGLSASSNIVNPTSSEVDWNNYKIRLVSIIAALDQGKHHDVTPMEHEWTDHKIVQYADSFYDPCYGKRYDTMLDMVQSFSFQYNNNSIGGRGVCPGTDGEDDWLEF